MKLKFLSKDKNSWVIRIKGEGHTLLNILKQKLQGDPSVKFAGYNQPHPLIDEFVLRVKGSNVKVSINKAIKGLMNDLSVLEKEIK